jgi:hypothetical protein
VTVAAVYDAITIARLSVEAALKPLVLTQQGGVGVPRLYWRKAQAGAPLPAVVHQSQGAGGVNASFLGFGGWEDEWTVKALANTDELAESWLAAIRAGMDSLVLPAAFPTGYSIQAIYDRPLVLPPDQQVFQSAAIWIIRITRS